MTALEFLEKQRQQLNLLNSYDIPLRVNAELKNGNTVALDVKDVSVVQVGEGCELRIILEE